MCLDAQQQEKLMREGKLLNLYPYVAALLVLWCDACSPREVIKNSLNEDEDKTVEEVLYDIAPEFLMCDNPTDEDEAHPVRQDLQLALARICVSESGFQVRTNDCLMIYHTLRNRSSTGELTMGMMRAYSPLSFNLERSDGHRWVAHLNARFTEPQGWSETVPFSWYARRDDWIAVYNFVGEMLASDLTPPCTLPPHHWGARGFRRRQLLSEGWILSECGETLNDFWTVPSRLEGEERMCTHPDSYCSIDDEDV